MLCIALLCGVCGVRAGPGKASAVPLTRTPGPVLTILENISVCGVDGSDDGMKIKKKKTVRKPS